MRVEDGGKILIADKGKTLICKCHNVILGTEVYLRKIMKNGILEEDCIDNYTEVDNIEEDI